MNSSVFEVQPLDRFIGSNAAIRRPKVRQTPLFETNMEADVDEQEIAYFSYDDEHRFHLDDSSLRYYYPPELPVDLKDGFDRFQQLNDSGDDHLDALLDTIIDLERRTGSRTEADVVTWRGMMTKVWIQVLGRATEIDVRERLWLRPLMR